jgi:hypothetical protein
VGSSLRWERSIDESCMAPLNGSWDVTLIAIHIPRVLAGRMPDGITPCFGPSQYCRCTTLGSSFSLCQARGIVPPPTLSPITRSRLLSRTAHKTHKKIRFNMCPLQGEIGCDHQVMSHTNQWRKDGPTLMLEKIDEVRKEKSRKKLFTTQITTKK